MTQFTSEQTGIIKSIVGGENVYGEARAGTGKTHTMIKGVAELHKKEPRRTILLSSYNVRIKQEIEDRLLKALGKTKLPDVISVRTINSLGFGVLSANRFWGAKELKVDGYKVQGMIREATSDKSVMRVLELAAVGEKAKFKLELMDYQKLLEEMVNTSKMFGFRPEHMDTKALGAVLEAALEKTGLTGAPIKPTQALAKLMTNILNYNIDLARAGLIDFNDQIYLAALYCASPGRQWDTTVCDEFQDCGSLMHTLIRRSAKKQLVYLGDSKQLIFKAVTGASIAPMTKWLDEQGEAVTRHTLTTTFRCSRVIAARQVEFGPLAKFEAFGGTKAPLGRVSFPYLADALDWPKRLKGKSALRPLWTFNVIANTKAAKRKSIGFLAAQNSVLIEALALAMREKATLTSSLCYCGQTYPITRWNLASSYQHNPAKAPTAILGAMAFFMQQSSLNAQQSMAQFEVWKSAPYEDGVVVFSTVHGWKGRECDSIYLMEPALLERDANVKYVAETRARTFLATLELQYNKAANRKCVGYFTDTGRKPVDTKAFTLIEAVTNSIPSAYRIPKKQVVERVLTKRAPPVFVKEPSGEKSKASKSKKSHRLRSR